MTCGYLENFFGNLKKKMLKFGNSFEILKFVKNKLNLEKIWKFGKGLEILKKKWEMSQGKTGYLGEKSLKFGKNICKLGKNLEIQKEIENLKKIWKFGKHLEI